SNTDTKKPNTFPGWAKDSNSEDGWSSKVNGTGYFVKKDDKDLWKATSFDSVVSLGKEIQKPLFKDDITSFPSAVSTIPQYVDVRSMPYFKWTDGAVSNYFARVITGQNVTYMCDQTTKIKTNWETVGDVWDVIFFFDWTNSTTKNDVTRMQFAAFDVYDYLLDWGYEADPSEAKNNKTAGLGDYVEYWPWGYK
ncbi:unnamed protein product, partial [Phaeothamnion confervicola]